MKMRPAPLPIPFGSQSPAQEGTAETFFLEASRSRPHERRVDLGRRGKKGRRE